MTQENPERVTGKQVLFDAFTLFKDAGTYIYELGKTVIVKIKDMIVTANDKTADDATHD